MRLGKPLLVAATAALLSTPAAATVLTYNFSAILTPTIGGAGSPSPVFTQVNPIGPITLSGSFAYDNGAPDTNPASGSGRFAQGGTLTLELASAIFGRTRFTETISEVITSVGPDGETLQFLTTHPDSTFAALLISLTLPGNSDGLPLSLDGLAAEIDVIFVSDACGTNHFCMAPLTALGPFAGRVVLQQSVPEPATAALLGFSLVALRRRRLNVTS